MLPEPVLHAIGGLGWGILGSMRELSKNICYLPLWICLATNKSPQTYTSSFAGAGLKRGRRCFRLWSWHPSLLLKYAPCPSFPIFPQSTQELPMLALYLLQHRLDLSLVHTQHLWLFAPMAPMHTTAAPLLQCLGSTYEGKVRVSLPQGSYRIGSSVQCSLANWAFFWYKTKNRSIHSHLYLLFNHVKEFYDKSTPYKLLKNKRLGLHNDKVTFRYLKSLEHQVKAIQLGFAVRTICCFVPLFVKDLQQY